MMKKLIFLDLDNTLIYGTSNPNLSTRILFKYSKNLIIYERPYAKEFVHKCHAKGDVVVYTTAVKDYAEQVCEHLQIKPVELFSREDCLVISDRFFKSVPDYYFDIYDEIVIVDDNVDVWDKKSRKNCRIVGVVPFTGEDGDDELIKIEI